QRVVCLELSGVDARPILLLRCLFCRLSDLFYYILLQGRSHQSDWLQKRYAVGLTYLGGRLLSVLPSGSIFHVWTVFRCVVHPGFGIYLVANYLQSLCVFVRHGVRSIQQAQSFASIQFVGDDCRAHHWWLPYFRTVFG